MGYFGKGRGIFISRFIWWKGLFWNIRIGRVSFVKELERWEDSLENRRRGWGLWAKLPFLLPSLFPQNRGGDGPGPAAWELVGARGVGGKGEGGTGS